MTFVIGTLQPQFKSEHIQVKWNKITRDMCKSDNIFQGSTLFKWILKIISQSLSFWGKMYFIQFHFLNV